MLRFAVLSHNWPEPHWDFLLESGTALRTWRLTRPPDCNGPIESLPLPDHRLIYLDYEGPVSGDRGEVARVMAGTYEILLSSPDRLEVLLQGPAGAWRGVFYRPTATDGTVEFTPAPPA